MTTARDELVVVTGATGYVGAHAVQQLLHAGYRVRGTVRKLPDLRLLEDANEVSKGTQLSADKLEERKQAIKQAKAARDKIDFLYHICPHAAHPLELVQADLTDADCWNEVVKGATYVLHVASPVPPVLGSTAYEEISGAAVDGTLNVFRASVEAGTVKRIVVTGSVASLGFTGSEISEDDSINDELMDGDNPFFSAYVKSKVFAEKAAWRFIDSLPEEKKIEVVMLLLVGVIGPFLGNVMSTSPEFMRTMVTDGAMPTISRMKTGFIDVRDAAACHIKALTVAEAVGKRIIISNESLWMEDIAKMLRKEFGPQGYNLPTAVAEDTTFDVTYSNKRMRKVLGFEPRDMEETVNATLYSLIERGFVPKKSGYRPRAQADV